MFRERWNLNLESCLLINERVRKIQRFHETDTENICVEQTKLEFWVNPACFTLHVLETKVGRFPVGR
jgi:hypothetical protein